MRAGEDDLNVLIPSHEPRIVELISKQIREDDNFVDVGASIGKYVLIASRYIKRGRIVALEPHPDAFRILLKTLNTMD